jgi:hypothetical protein
VQVVQVGLAGVEQAGFRPDVIFEGDDQRRLLPATDLFRRHVIRRAAAGRLPAVSD